MPHDIAFYLSKGFDLRTAQYFAAGRKTITRVTPCEGLSLLLYFDNGECRRLDCSSFVQPGTVFSPLLQWDCFRRVYLDDAHCVSWDIDPSVDSSAVWNNKLDLCPDTCYLDSIPVSACSECLAEENHPPRFDSYLAEQLKNPAVKSEFDSLESEFARIQSDIDLQK